MKSIDEFELNIYGIYKEHDISLRQTKIILFTSGTTSAPKAIMLSEENLLSNIMSISEYLKLKKDDTILLIKDLSHSSSITSELFVGLFNGCRIIMTTRLPLTRNILNIIDTKRVSIFFAVPTIVKGIMTYSQLNNFDLSSLRILNFYGAPMNYLDILHLLEIFPKINVIYSYGQTEASPRITYNERANLINKPASCGRPIKNVAVHIEDKNGTILGPMNQGEIVVTGPNVMLGYYKNPEKTLQVKKGNKLYTGDLGYLDEDGFLYITGRSDNLIISAGKNIYPEEIEGVLTTYEGIVEALCVEEKGNNEISNLIAYVVLNHGSKLDYNQLFNYCREHLELYKIPKQVIIVNELEKTPSGKVKRDFVKKL